jgi:hypothetical protein
MKVHARGHEVTYEDGSGKAKWKWKMGSFLAMESTLHLFWAPNLKWAMWVGLKIGCPKFWVVCDHLPQKKVAIRAIPTSRVTQAARLGTMPTRQSNKMVTSRTILISHEIMLKSQNHIETYYFQEWLFPELRNNQLLVGPTQPTSVPCRRSPIPAMAPSRAKNMVAAWAAQWPWLFTIGNGPASMNRTFFYGMP